MRSWQHFHKHKKYETNWTKNISKLRTCRKDFSKDAKRSQNMSTEAKKNVFDIKKCTPVI